MSEMTFLEVSFTIAADYSIDDRQDMEDRLNEVLQHAGLGEVTGGGSGLGEANIDIEVSDPQRALPLIRDTLRFLAVPAGAVIRQSGAPSIDHPVYE